MQREQQELPEQMARRAPLVSPEQQAPPDLPELPDPPGPLEPPERLARMVRPVRLARPDRQDRCLSISRDT